MSTTWPLPPWAVRLIDDAAVFPPGLSPVDVAWADHLALRNGPYAECVGPLLIAAEHVAALVRVATEGPARASAQESSPPLVPVSLIGRGGTAIEELAPAIASLTALPTVRVEGLELAHDSGWQSALEPGLPLAVEVSRVAADRDRGLDEVAEARQAAHTVKAKLRTQATTQAPVPTASELAGFIVACQQRELPFKLTGGLHHALVTVTDASSVREHGVVNVLLAAHVAHTGAAPAEIERLLSRTDGSALAAELRTLSVAQQDTLRAAFTSYGCCGVLDPITELGAVGLLPAPDQP